MMFSNTWAFIGDTKGMPVQKGPLLTAILGLLNQVLLEFFGFFLLIRFGVQIFNGIVKRVNWNYSLYLQIEDLEKESQVAQIMLDMYSQESSESRYAVFAIETNKGNTNFFRAVLASLFSWTQ